MTIETLAFIHQVLLEERDRRSKAWNAAKRAAEEKERAAYDGFGSFAAAGAMERAQTEAEEAHEKFLWAQRHLNAFEAHNWN